VPRAWLFGVCAPGDFSFRLVSFCRPLPPFVASKGQEKGNVPRDRTPYAKRAVQHHPVSDPPRMRVQIAGSQPLIPTVLYIVVA
jgi:hypothetical protein